MSRICIPSCGGTNESRADASRRSARAPIATGDGMVVDEEFVAAVQV